MEETALYRAMKVVYIQNLCAKHMQQFMQLHIGVPMGSGTIVDGRIRVQT